jgi:hypothetical protein
MKLIINLLFALIIKISCNGLTKNEFNFLNYLDSQQEDKNIFNPISNRYLQVASINPNSTCN